LNLLHVTNCIIEFIRNEVTIAKSQGVILGLSGGIDSSVALYLATKALGNTRVLGLILPDKKVSQQNDIDDAIELSQKVGINYHIIDITEIKQKYLDILPLEKISIGNLTARIRMNFIYYYSNIENKLVLGTSDKSELMIGYFTKFGDGAADMLPIGGLYKTQVRILATRLGVSEQIINQPSSPRFWRGHEAEKELGLTYDEIDLILQYYLAGDLDKCNLSKRKIKMVTDLVRKSSHKREQMPICDPI